MSKATRLHTIAESHPRIYADGVFDLFHHGHARVLQQAKLAKPNAHLIVGIHSDAVVHALKGPTVMTYAERLESLRHCKWVDEIIEDAPWVIDADFLTEHAIDFVAHDGDPYPLSCMHPDSSGETVADLYELPKRMGIFIATERTVGVSTSDIIQRILDNVGLFKERNESRNSQRSPNS